jgi:hypothetical protein
VPLKRYAEVGLRGRKLIAFLENERPDIEDVRVPKMYLPSELTGSLSSHRTPLGYP